MEMIDGASLLASAAFVTNRATHKRKMDRRKLKRITGDVGGGLMTKFALDVLLTGR